MHKLALQDAELKLLRETNKELTNRRKTKNKNYGKEDYVVFKMQKSSRIQKR
jgi:hypothetical protein